MTNNQNVTQLTHYLEIQVPVGERDFATAYKPIAEAQANWERVLESERARLNTPPGKSPFDDPNSVPEPDYKLEEHLVLETELYEVTVKRYRESFGLLNGEGSFVVESPCHTHGSAFCTGWHSIAGFGIALFAQAESYLLNPSLKEVKDGEFENSACYYGSTVLLVHGSPTNEEIRGRYRLNDHTVLVVEGVENWFLGLDKPKDITGIVRTELTIMPLEKLPATADQQTTQ